MTDDLPGKLADLALQLSTLKGYWDNGLGLLHKLHQEITQIKYDHAVLANKFSNHQYDLSSALQEFSKLKDLVSTIREEFARNLHASHKILEGGLESKQKGITEMIASHQDKIARFESLIDQIALDAQNAVLKAANADMMVTLNRKKVENVQLLVQNQQLQK